MLIVEDDSDGHAVRNLTAPIRLPILVDWLPANGIGNISRNGERLIALAKDRIGSRGCVAVLIDGDGKNPARDEPHRTIARVCRARNVPLVVARESLEAWMLADPGVCEWLDIPIRPGTDRLRDPKGTVRKAFFKKTGRDYRRRRARTEVTQQATGPSVEANDSLRTALRHLEGCGVVTARGAA